MAMNHFYYSSWFTVENPKCAAHHMVSLNLYFQILNWMPFLNKKSDWLKTTKIIQQDFKIISKKKSDSSLKIRVTFLWVAQKFWI